MLYVDTSAYLKRYLEEAESDACVARMTADSEWVTATLTLVEVRRNLAGALGPDALAEGRRDFAVDWQRTARIDLDQLTMRRAAEIAETTGCRSLDAVHLAAADRLRTAELRVLTYDRRQRAVAEGMGLDCITPA